MRACSKHIGGAVRDGREMGVEYADSTASCQLMSWTEEPEANIRCHMKEL